MGRGKGGSTNHTKRTPNGISTSSKMTTTNNSTSFSPHQLSDQEKKIFAILNKVAEQHGATVRVAGGWVRDKILGKENKDIDISLDKMTGAEFAKLVNKEMGGNDNQVSVIAENPEQSKHLETATMKIDGLPIDMVNLRTETYTDDSRIPETKIGTPEEDARRRDLTINSLFYNLKTGEVEDHTGQGISDLKKGVIRTPIDAKSSFLDDPLRTLRAIRFAARYGYKMAPEVIDGMKDKDVQNALQNKISAERILKELKEALQKDPVMTVKTLTDTGLSNTFIPELSAMDMEQKNKYHDKTVLNHTLGLLEHIHKIDPNNLALKWAALLHDVGKPKAAKTNPKNPDQLMFVGHEEESAQIAENIFQRLRLDKATANKALKLIKDHGMDANPNWSEQKFNSWLFSHFKTKEEWDNWNKLREADITASSPTYYNENMGRHKEIVARANPIVDKIIGMKPFLSGEEIKQALNNNKPGKWIGEVNNRLVELQLSGQLKTKEDAENYLRKQELTEDGKLRKRKDPVDGSFIPKPYEIKNPTTFQTSIDKAKKDGLAQDKQNGTYGTKASEWHGAFVHTYSPEDYQNMKLIGIANGGAGLAIKKSGDIVSVFKNPKAEVKDAMSILIPEAIAQGGNRLDCFNGYLPGTYALYGFEPVAKLKFNREYAPEHWNYERDGEPDIIFMAHDGTNPEQIKANIHKMRQMAEADRKTYRKEIAQKTKEKLATIPEVSSYEEAEKLQSNFVNKNKI